MDLVWKGYFTFPLLGGLVLFQQNIPLQPAAPDPDSYPLHKNKPWESLILKDPMFVSLKLQNKGQVKPGLEFPYDKKFDML